MMPPNLDAAAWAEVQGLFERCADLPADAREPWLAEHCDDPGIRSVVRSLLAADEHADEVADPLRPPLTVLQDWLHAIDEDDRAPTEIGHYRVEREIGRGATSRVFLATRASLGGRLALKLLRYDPAMEGEIRQRFAFEHRLLARLEHRNIARLLDAGITPDGVAYLAMEYVEGQPITDYCRTQGLSVSQRVDLFLQVCDAVGHAHRRGVIHRDLKPANVLVNQRGSVKLLDFGIGKSLAEEEDMPRTRTAMRLMTPQYAAPEQLQGAEATTLSDVYALGVILFELLTGVRPYHRFEQSQERLAQAIAETVPPNPSRRLEGTQRRAVRGDLDAIALHALHADPAQRYADVGALAADLRRYLSGEAVQARGMSMAYRSRKFLARHRWPVIAATLVLMAGAFYTWREATLRQQAERALAVSEQVSGFLLDLVGSGDPLAIDIDHTRPLSVREALDIGAGRLDSELAGQPLIAAAVKVRIGQAYAGLARFEDAERLWREALATFEATPGHELEAADVMFRMARQFSWRQRWDEAQALAESAYRLRRNELGEDHPVTADSVAQLAYVATDRGEFERAQRLYLQAYDVRRRQEPPDVLAVAQSAHELGWVYDESSDLPQSLDWYARGLELRLEHLPRAHPLVLESMSMVGMIYQDMGRYAEARPYLVEAVEIAELLVAGGAATGELGRMRHYLGQNERELGDLESAERLARQGLASLLEVYGHTDMGVNSARRELAITLALRGKRDEAIELVDTITDLSRELGYPHYLAISLTGRGRVLALLGDTEAALAAFRESLGIFRKTLTPAGNRRQQTATLLAQALRDAERCDAATLPPAFVQGRTPPWSEQAQLGLEAAIDACLALAEA